MPTFTHATHPTHSYNGYKKSKVFAEWQKRLQKQEYEAACHWTAELDVSGWADDLWAKVVVYASKHVHLHSPSLPVVLARNFAYHVHHTAKHATSAVSNVHLQARNDPTLRQNLCQVVGLLALTPKGPVYTLPKVDPEQVNEADVLVGTHVWLAPYVDTGTGDCPTVVRLLSTVCWQLESNHTHKAMYWLSVLVEYEKRHKKLHKRVPAMRARKPIPYDANAPTTMHSKAATDWVWLLWYGLWQACKRYQRPVTCGKAFKALAHLFAHDYVTTKRNTRMPLLLHAMLLVRSSTVDWRASSDVYPNAHAKTLITKACGNVELMYQSVANKRETREQRLGLVVGADTAHESSAVVDPRANVVSHTNKPSATTGKPTSKARKPSSGMSADSAKKMAVMDAIDAQLFAQA